MPYVYIADLAILKGYSDKDGSYLISLIGILNMVGEVNLLKNVLHKQNVLCIHIFLF